MSRMGVMICDDGDTGGTCKRKKRRLTACVINEWKLEDLSA